MTYKRVNTTRDEIIKKGLEMYLEKGYSNTSPKAISRDLGISPGLVTHYFPSKENMLALLIEMLANYQWEVFQKAVDDGETPITALCLELTAMAAMCEDSEIARDLYISAYTKPLALSIVRKTDEQRARQVFAEYCPGWTDEQWAQAEGIVSGIEYATICVTPESPSLETRITGAMNSILLIYGVPEERRKMKIKKALSMDYRKYGQHILEDFKEYVFENINKPFEGLKQVGFHYVKETDTDYAY